MKKRIRPPIISDKKWCGHIKVVRLSSLKITKADLIRFGSKFEKAENGCWNWKSSFTGSGYGQFSIGRTKLGAHRFSFFIHFNCDPDGLVCHKCDNPKCINPSHLFIGSHRINMKDMSNKFRRSGEHNPFARLTESDVREVHRLWLTGKHRKADIGRILDISMSHVGAIIRGHAWRHIYKAAV